jgi:hypothetical protein
MEIRKSSNRHEDAGSSVAEAIAWEQRFELGAFFHVVIARVFCADLGRAVTVATAHRHDVVLKNV